MTLVQTFIYMLVWSNVRCFYFRPPTHDNESKQTLILEGNINQIRCQHHSVKWLNFSYSQRHEQKCIQRNMCSIIRSNIITDSTDFILVSSWLNVCTNTGRGGAFIVWMYHELCVCLCVNDDEETGVCWWEGDTGQGRLWFWTGRQDETPGPCHPGESRGVAPRPPISTAAPKHAGYLGSLRTDLWLKSQRRENKQLLWKLNTLSTMLLI